MEAAFTVVGIGVRPRVDLGRSAGLAEADGIITDLHQRASHPAVWSAGDVARTNGSRVEHWHVARESGERVALSMLGLPVPPPPPAWIFTEVGGATVDVVGSASDGDEERWIREDAVLAYLAGEQVVGLAIIDSGLDPGTARELIAANASAEAVGQAIGGLA